MRAPRQNVLLGAETLREAWRDFKPETLREVGRDCQQQLGGFAAFATVVETRRLVWRE